jgi:hypothetical protein
MIGLIAEAAVIVACALLMLLSVAVVGVMSRTGSWGAFGLWLGVALAAFVVGAQWREVPLPVALLLLTLSVLVWRQRRRIMFAVEHGMPW